MQNDYVKQKTELVSLGLLPAPGRLGDSLYAHSCNSTAQAKKIDQMRQKYLSEMGSEAIKAKFPKAYFLCWPGL